ncbi:hypothetical protein MNEG_11348 [Monoraphidium neglectum]|uniref:Right handed beta helix domain-containing protein n=1 Tax=Monoraphidium neglectum TaxID=145388 RepID=A0A0D2KLK6_9CHLO|nr:hypothetical protein MNEG_11348 [Monoraphidium neglectum]KIY96613.1 hypothetical protein MNEG_11348 [Monoraphidium neglectum]|eukprot:XP_013895633.1 hypothetical protein MNEG_11348 [Monoraphidium neglectum]
MDGRISTRGNGTYELYYGLVTSAAWAAQQLQPARAEAAILVGPAQSGGKFATINEAIAAAEQGGIITVLPGRYEERITLDGKFVTIQAAQAGSVEVVWESSRPYEHTLECKNTQGAVVVRGMLLRHRSPSVAQNYCVFVGAGSSLVLEACDVSSSSGNGVGVEGATLQLKDSQVHNCERHGVAAFGGFEGAPGRCLVMGCAIKSNKLSGVFVRDGGNAVLRDNTVVDNGEYGVALLDGCTARLFDNKVAGNAAGSVRVDVGSVAVDVSEVNGKNALDTPAAAIRL